MNQNNLLKKRGLIVENENSSYLPKVIILKIVSQCNLNCTYCHWFRNDNVYQQPRTMKKEVFDMFIIRLESYLKWVPFKKIAIFFHGGEPLLIKREMFSYMCEEIKQLEKKINKKIKLMLTTNGVLITDQWINLFARYQIGVTVSIDGDKAVHDEYRIDLKNNGSYDRAVAGVEKLEKHGYNNFIILAVCHPAHSPKELCEHFIYNMKVKCFDILIPNNNHNDKKNGLVKPIANFYIQLFDLWFDNYRKLGIKIKIVTAFIEAILYGKSYSSGIGFSPANTMVIMPDGQIVPHDVLGINDPEQINTGLNVFNNPLEDLLNHKYWLLPLAHSITIPDPCHPCDIKEVCRGGKVIHRYSSENEYNNPSVYCEDLKKIYSHISDRLLKFANVAYEG